MRHIGIIGAGFSGTMVAVNLICQITEPWEISMFDSRAHFNKGIAYSAYSDTHLLNVPCAKMSAFSDRPSHFLDWVLSLPTYWDKDANQIEASFLPRKLYGSYLESICENALTTAASKHIKVNIINSVVTHLNVSETGAALDLDNGNVSNVHYAIIATGNHTPRHPSIENMAFYERETYDQNPWLPTAISAPHYNNLPILILGNGLTMVDT